MPRVRQLNSSNGARRLVSITASTAGTAPGSELATEAARILKVPARFEAVRFADVKLPAARPKYCALANRKLTSLGIQMPTWQDALARYIESPR